MSQLAERFAEAGEPLASGQVRQQAPESWRPRDSQPGRGRELRPAGEQQPQPKAAGPEQPLPEQVLVPREAELRAATRPRDQTVAAEAERLAWPEQPE
ncbi:MAG: hypothetical protein ACRD88_18725 [Terriglobia bacterium]